jgi:hypothetical protein
MSCPRVKQHTARIGGVIYSFNGLVELMAKPRHCATMPS